MVDVDIVKAAKGFAKELHAKKESDTFEDWHYTEAVVAASEKIGRENLLLPGEMQTVELASWLHRTGTNLTTNNEGSITLATDFLSIQGLPPAEIERVIQCIRAGQEPQNPQNNLEEVFCDAINSLFAADEYITYVTRFVAQLPANPLERADWLKKHRSEINSRVYFTNYARQAFSEGKEKNADRLKKMRKQARKEQEQQNEILKETKKQEKEAKKEKEQKASKGIETLFRTTMASHMQLSIMADNKANLMISINTITASIMVSSFLRKFEEEPQLMIPTLCLTLVCVLTIVFAVMATRPNIKTDFVRKEKTDMLFFGEFTQLSPEVYKEGIRQIMRNNDLLYDSMIDNIYSQGLVLTKKYRLLKIAYTIFMFGFGFVLLIYAAALIFYPTAQ